MCVGVAECMSGWFMHLYLAGLCTYVWLAYARMSGWLMHVCLADACLAGLCMYGHWLAYLDVPSQGAELLALQDDGVEETDAEDDSAPVHAQGCNTRNNTTAYNTCCCSSSVLHTATHSMVTSQQQQLKGCKQTV